MKRPTCPVCSQGFGWPELVQSGERLYGYKCEICNRLFNTALKEKPKLGEKPKGIDGGRKPGNPYYYQSNPGNYTS